MFELVFSDKAKEQLSDIKRNLALLKRFKAITKALHFLRENPKHPSLHTHIFHSALGPNGEKLFEAYAESNTPGAYRILFCYGQDGKSILIVSVIPHP